MYNGFYTGDPTGICHEEDKTVSHILGSNAGANRRYNNNKGWRGNPSGCGP